MIDPMLDVKDRLIMAVLPNVPFEGWTMKALAEAATALGLDASLAERAFPGGPVMAALHFADLADRRLSSEAAEADLTSLGLTARVKWLVRRRLEAWTADREAVRRAVSLFSLPGNVAKATRATWQTSDRIWYLAGDSSVDFSYYTKRASLAAVYSATLLTWLSDGSDDAAVTWDFLERRTADLAKIPRALQALRGRIDAFGKPFGSLVAAARKQAGRVRNFGL
jgi:ubiquinone biosynthesis protein COQ9